MARIAILEPWPDVRELFATFVARLGHEPVLVDGAIPEDVDLLLLEPADPELMGRARAALRQRAGLPVICVSIYPQAKGAAELSPKAYLVKPIDLKTLGAAVDRALAA